MRKSWEREKKEIAVVYGVCAKVDNVICLMCSFCHIDLALSLLVHTLNIEDLICFYYGVIC